MNDLNQQPDVELVAVSKEFRGRQQDVLAVRDLSLAVAPGEFFALLGPSGCGKTTTLRMIAGFEQPTQGEVLIRGVAMQGIPPFHRPVNTVFQDYALFPHMTVTQNVEFGLRMAGLARDVAEGRAAKALDLVQLPGVGSRRPRQLSGGQQQRVALARALVNEPAVLLLDEPLGALDLKLRKQMQFELKAMQQRLGISFIYVTHDQEEAMTMADRIGVMHDGQLLQIGAPEEIYDQPVDRFVADFIGETNFLEGRLEELSDERGSVRTQQGDLLLQGTLPKERVSIGAGVTLTIRPEKLTLLKEDAQAAKVSVAVFRGGNGPPAGYRGRHQLYRYRHPLRSRAGRRRAFDGSFAEFRRPLRHYLHRRRGCPTALGCRQRASAHALN